MSQACAQPIDVKEALSVQQVERKKKKGWKIKYKLEKKVYVNETKAKVAKQR